MLRRTGPVFLLATLVVGGLPLVPTAQAIQCGVWRWPVKTLSDSRAHLVNFTPVRRRVAALRLLTPPGSLSSSTPRLQGIERRNVTVRARLIEAKIEEDHDVHLVIAVPHHPRKTMIVEFPYRRCNWVSTSFKRRAMAQARNQVLAACGSIPTSSFVRLKGAATITGVGFWDEIHGQTGVAPNGIELHPVLRFSGTCSRA